LVVVRSAAIFESIIPDKNPAEYRPASGLSRMASSGAASLSGGGGDDGGGGAPGGPLEGGGGAPAGVLEGGGGAPGADFEGGGGAAEAAPCDGGGGAAPLVCVGWLAGTVTAFAHDGQANFWPAAVSSTVSSVPQVGHGNFKSIGQVE
jgi:hypothetical protein